MALSYLLGWPIVHKFDAFHNAGPPQRWVLPYPTLQWRAHSNFPASTSLLQLFPLTGITTWYLYLVIFQSTTCSLRLKCYLSQDKAFSWASQIDALSLSHFISLLFPPSLSLSPLNFHGTFICFQEDSDLRSQATSYYSHPEAPCYKKAGSRVRD